jgi:hypothetical protein
LDRTPIDPECESLGMFHEVSEGEAIGTIEGLPTRLTLKLLVLSRGGWLRKWFGGMDLVGAPPG